MEWGPLAGTEMPKFIVENLPDNVVELDIEPWLTVRC